MGLAASQARYLALSARKTNVEYEGQQINQQRLTLSNQSANLFNQMLTMSVPVPPSTSDYTKLQYSWSDGINTYVMEDYYQLGTINENFNYVVTSYHYKDVYTGQRKYLNDPQIQATKTNHFSDLKDTTYTINSIYYSKSNDTYSFSMVNAAGTEYNMTYTAVDTTSDKDAVELLDYIYGRTTEANSEDFTYDETNDTYTYNGATYTLVDVEDSNALSDLRSSYGALYDSSKTYYTDGSSYICREDINEANDNLTDKVYIRTKDTDKYYTDGTNYISLSEIGNLSVGGTITVHSATNTPTFSNYKAVGNCTLTALDEDMYNSDATIITELAQILKDMAEDTDNTISYERLKACFDENGDYISGSIYMFTMDGVTYYTTTADLDESLLSAYNKDSTASNSIDSQQSKLTYYKASYISTKITDTQNALLATDGAGRFSTVKFENDSVVYDLTVETVTDDAAYNDAMNHYYYEQDAYDKQITDINAKTEIIQAQDRQLQLKLEQLDTEQSALQTEMEACQKVVSKSIDDSFKTFNH